MTDSIFTLAVVLVSVLAGAAIALIAVHVARRNQSSLGEETVREILGYGPPLWPMGPTNGHREPDEPEEVG